MTCRAPGRNCLLVTINAILAIAMVVGCGGGNTVPLGKVSGTVTYQGKAVEGANITFYPDGPAPRMANGRTDAQGNFKLTTFDTNDGAVLGEHVITISKPNPKVLTETMDASNPNAAYDAAMRQSQNQSKKGAAEMAPTILPKKYAKKEDSPLKRSVAQGDNSFKIELED